MILKNKLCGSAARLGRGFQTRPAETAKTYDSFKINTVEGPSSFSYKLITFITSNLESF